MASENISSRECKKTPDEGTELRIVMVGRVGSGKSASANTILGREAFKAESPQSVTKTCAEESGKVAGRIIKIVETPTLFGAAMADNSLKKEIEKCVEMSCPGPHAFLLVIRLGVSVTDEEKNAVMWIKENFGDRALKYTILLLTYGDQLKERDPWQIPAIQSLIQNCRGGYHVFNNKDNADQSQVTSLLQKIQAMVKQNNGEYYTNKMYQDAQEKLREEIREEREKRQAAERNAEQEREKAEIEIDRERRKREEAEIKAKEERKQANKVICEERENAERQRKEKMCIKRKAEEDISNVRKKLKEEVSGLKAVSKWGGVAGACLLTGGLVVAGAAGAAVAGVGAATLAGAALLGVKVGAVDRDIPNSAIKTEMTWEEYE